MSHNSFIVGPNKFLVSSHQHGSAPTYNSSENLCKVGKKWRILNEGILSLEIKLQVALAPTSEGTARSSFLGVTHLCLPYAEIVCFL